MFLSDYFTIESETVKANESNFKNLILLQNKTPVSGTFL